MISKTDILKMARKVTRRSGGQKERAIISPRREWLMGVFLFLVIATAGAVLSARDYGYYNTLDQRVEDVTTPIKKYKEGAARDATVLYAERMAAFNGLVDDVPSVIKNGTTTDAVDETASSTELVATSTEEVLIEAETDLETL